GWSSPVARQAHNLKAAGSNPAPATKLPIKTIRKKPASCGLFAFQKVEELSQVNRLSAIQGPTLPTPDWVSLSLTLKRG
ncbi:hypothetical protein ACC704_31030, partial [Rhizobium johnstonii]|uniref:hypothetical protein n=1 Tax=Rhizobium johnstonii TaxID=3019933 RepID=UPI003F994157